MKKTLHIIPHSHWDREWYLPFEKHRVRLVELFDTLIDVMEQNPDYTYYHMDGQYIVIDAQSSFASLTKALVTAIPEKLSCAKSDILEKAS